MSRPRVGIITCARMPEADPDEEVLLEALRKAGAEPEMIAWDDDRGRPAAMSLCVLRSPWNYHHAVDEFLGWAGRTATLTQVVNPPNVVRWNVHKGYLLELAERGVPVVPTQLVRRGNQPPRAAVEQAAIPHGLVVKPAVSAGSYQTRRFAPGELDEALCFLCEVLESRDALVQPYMPSVDGYGERSVICIDGEITHSIRKSPRFASDSESVSSAISIDAEVAEVARAALRSAPGPVLYGRADIVLDDAQRPCIAELELIEPSLFLRQCDAALTRLANAVVRTANRAHEVKPC